MRIEILGTGCSRCDALVAGVEAAVAELGLDCEVAKVSDLAKIASYGVMITPALVIDGTVRSSGKLLEPNEIAALLRAS